jgi:hypothetical protein
MSERMDPATVPLPEAVPESSEPKSKPKPRKRKSGQRGPHLTEQRVKLLVKALSLGTPRMQCARLVGVTYQTLKNWWNRGEAAWERAGQCEEKVKEDDRLYVSLFVGAGQSMAKAVQDALSNVKTAGKKNWQAAAWLLARWCPERFADNRHELIALKKQLAELLKALAELQNARVPAEKVPESPVPTPEVPA